jgi:hypothetical protein
MGKILETAMRLGSKPKRIRKESMVTEKLALAVECELAKLKNHDGTKMTWVDFVEAACVSFLEEIRPAKAKSSK